MARIRSIKPDFFTSEDVSSLPLRARLTWIGLWTHCDDHGRTKDVVRLIKAAVWPLDDVSLSDVEQDLTVLAEQRRIVRYAVDGKAFLAVVNWHAHQAISKPGKAQHPAPPIGVNPTDPTVRGYCRECAMSVPVTLPEGSGSATGGLLVGKEGKGGEQGGGTRAQPSAGTLPDIAAEPEPPLKCPNHLRDPHPPRCGACGDARREHQAWQRRRAPRPAPPPGRPHCPVHPEHPTGSKPCPACASENTPAPNLRALRDSALEAS